MVIGPGTRLGPYEIAAEIGAGGMGQVFRALDTNLGRDVAIKVLPDAFAHDAERLARFEREARTLASLNHPNIAIIHGLEKTGTVRALVMELVEGPTLADRVAQGPMPLDEALPIASQIAEALAAAHDHGVVHRDLKPANIKLRPDATVKVLDFGLAKAIEPAPGDMSVMSMSPTITTPAMTRVGMILGTAAYMSPEQARGKAVDKRADIWAFGAVVYELVTGRRPFDGEDIADTLAKVIQAEPRWDDVPHPVQRLLKKCLEKDPKKRLRDIGDAWQLLEGPSTPEPLQSRIGLAPWALAILFAVLSVLALWAPWRPPQPAVQSLRFQIHPPPESSFAHFVDDSPVVSPDGKRVAFLATGQDGRVRIWIRDFDSLDARRLDGTEEATWPFWSADGLWIAFAQNNNQLSGLMKVPVAGGPGQALCNCAVIGKGAWSAEGVVVFGNSQGMMKVSENGGAVTPLTRTDPSRGELVHNWPSFLPDGRHFVYTRYARDAGAVGLYVGSIDAKPGEQPLDRVLDIAARYASGRLLFVKGSTLMAQDFDVGLLRVSGQPQPIARLPQVEAPNPGGAALAYGGVTPGMQLTWFSRDGKPLAPIGEAGDVAAPRLSPDDVTVAYNRFDTGPPDVWLHEPKRGSSQFTFRTPSGRPVWSPDGGHVGFSSAVEGKFVVVRKASNGLGGDEVLFKSDDDRALADWSLDDKYLILAANDPKTKQDVWVLPRSGDEKSFPYLNQDYAEAQPRLSPNGRWLAYIADKNGRFEVYVDTFTGGARNGSSTARGTWQVSSGGGTRPVWSRDGKALFYISTDRKMMVVDVHDAGGTRFDYSAPRPSFDVQISSNPWDEFDVSRDGRFLMPIPVQQGSHEPITVIVNWAEALKR